MIDATTGDLIDGETGVVIEPPATTRPANLLPYFPPWYQEEKAAKRAGLPVGPAWFLFDEVVALMEANAAGPWTEATPQELKAMAGMTDEAFDRVWLKVRVRFVKRGARLYWPPLERAHAAARVSFERLDARNSFGGRCNAVRLLLHQEPPLRSSDAEKMGWAARMQEARIMAMRCQEHLLKFSKSGGRRKWIDEAAHAVGRVFLSMSDARRGAFARLLDVAKVLKIDRSEVERLWKSRPAVAHDLAMRHRLNVLSFNALRLALMGALTSPWRWSEDWDHPDGLAAIVVGL